MAKYIFFIILVFLGNAQANNLGGDPEYQPAGDLGGYAVDLDAVKKMTDELIAGSGDPLTGDETLACQILLCMSSPTQPSECAPIMAKYFKKLIPKHPFDNPERRMRKFLKLCPTGDSGATASYLSNCSLLIDDLNTPNQYGNIATDVPDQCKQPLPESEQELPPEVAENITPESESLMPEIEPYSVVLPVRVVHWEVVCDAKDERGRCKSKQYWAVIHEWIYVEDIKDNQTVIYDPNTGERYPIPDHPD